MSSRWTLESSQGLMLKNVTLDNFADYECIGTLNGISTRKHFRLVVTGIISSFQPTKPITQNRLFFILP